MVIAIYFLIILASAVQSACTKLFNRHCSHSFVFNSVKSCAALVMFGLFSVFGFELCLPTALFGGAYGICLCLSMYTGYQALCRGPMALTSMLVSFSVIIPLVWGITAGNEKLSLLQYPALALLLLSVILTNLDKIKINKAERTDYPSWLLFVGVTFLCNGVCSILQKQHQNLYSEGHSNEFMLCATLLCSLVFTALMLKKISVKELKKVKGKRYGVLSGLANGLANLLTLVLAGFENAAVLFPIISAGTILASLACGRIVFKEKLKLNHYAALLFGIAAVVLLKL